MSTETEPAAKARWWRKYDIPWVAWPFVVVAIVASVILLTAAGVIGALVNPSAGWFRIVVLGLIGTVALPFTGNWGWAAVALVAAIVAGTLEVRQQSNKA